MENQTLSKPVTSTQTEPHRNLVALVQKHRDHPFQKPIAAYNQTAFDDLSNIVAAHSGPLILDSGCGTGDSTRQLSLQHPEALVIGIDRSEHRLNRQRADNPANCVLIRADLIDMWRLIAQTDWPIRKHYLLYPNPEPKPTHIKRRFHAHPVFPTLAELAPKLELRSNWWVYLAEMQQALEVLGIDSQIREITTHPITPVTLFEQKYRRSGHRLWQLSAQWQNG